MEQVGVELVVQGLTMFAGDMLSAQEKVDNLAGSGTILQSAFNPIASILDGVGNAIAGVGNSILRTVEYAMGQILADAIEDVLGKLKDLAQGSIDAGVQFQELGIRLQNINFATAIDSGKDFTAAMAEAKDLTKEELDWIMKLARETPFDATDIANIYALGRSYGYADEQARKISEATLNFTSAMGLGNVEAERIVKNFGQMSQQGKITQRDLNDLARGAFVPVNNLLEEIRKRFETSGSASIDFSEDISKLNEKMAGYTEQLKIAEQKQKEYDEQQKNASAKAAEQNAEAIGKAKNKLEDLNNSLNVAIQKQLEFTEKTSESTKMANQFTIDKLRREISDTTTEIEKLSSGAGTMAGAVKESTRMANQQKIDELKKNIASTGEQLATFQAIMGGTGKITKEMFTGMLRDGIPAQEFIDSFVTMVQTRFPQASLEMTRTFEGASKNISQTVQDLIGFNVVLPVLDVLGKKLSSAFEVITGGENYDKLQAAAAKIGEALANVVGRLFDLGPSTETLGDTIVNALLGVADWINANANTFVKWVKDMIDWVMNVLIPTIRDQLIPFIRDQLLPAFKEFVDWIWSNREGIIQFFKDVGTTIQNDVIPFVRDILVPAIKDFVKYIIDNREQIFSFFKDMGNFIKNDLAPWIRDTLVPAIKEFIGWLKDHQKEITPWLERIVTIFAAYVIIQQVIVWVAGLVSAFISFAVSVVAVVAFLSTLGSTIAGVISIIGEVIAIVAAAVIGFEIWKTAFASIGDYVSQHFSDFLSSIKDTIYDIGNAIENHDWSALGRAVLEGISAGLLAAYHAMDLVGIISEIAMSLINAFRDVLGISSPSTVFYDFGYNIVEGIVNGIRDNSGAMMDALTSAAEEMWQAWLDFWGIHSPSKLSSDSADNIMGSFSDEILKKTNSAVSAMQKVAVSIAAPMINLPAVTQSYATTSPAMVGASSNTTNYYNLNINSSANTEPIVSDFNMLESMAGA